MSRLTSVANMMEKYSDLLNPILVKENRQSLKSRQFVITFMLLLLVSWIITVWVTAMYYGQMEYGRVGPIFVTAYFWVLGVAVFVVVPYGAYRSLMAERDEFTSELLAITTLSASRVVWGKLYSAMLQLFIYYSAISPFIAFTSLLEGFEQFPVMFSLIWSMVLSLMLSTFMMMLSLNSRQKHWQALSTLFAFGLLMFAFVWITGVLTAFMHSPIDFDSLEFWLWNVFLLIGCLSYAVLFQQITAAQLTHESGNRSTKIRIVTSAQFFLVWLTIATIMLFTSAPSGSAEIFVTLFVVLFLHWGIVSLFVSTEHDYLSRRIRRDLPRRRLWRALLIPFLPGGAFGFMYSAIHIVALLALVMYAASNYSYGTSIRVNPEAFIGLACYYIIFAGLGTFLIRNGHALSGEFRPAHARIVTVLFVLFCIIAPLIPRVFSQYSRYTQYEVYDIVNPVYTVNYLAGVGYSNSALDRDTTLMILIGAAVVSIVCNLPAFLRATKIVLHAEETLPEFIDSANVLEIADDVPEAGSPLNSSPQSEG